MPNVIQYQPFDLVAKILLFSSKNYRSPRSYNTNRSSVSGVGFLRSWGIRRVRDADVRTNGVRNAMSEKADPSQNIVPAHLRFLAIYSPSLGAADETLENQIVYYFSYDPKGDRPTKRGTRDPQIHQDALREQKNEQLRQIGLAQGMVEFSRTFSNGKAVDTVDTAKSRTIIHELEAGWWILAVGSPFP